MRRTKKQQTHVSPTRGVRIIGGAWRSRKLPVADVEGLRPSGDRIRETLFNWLAGDLHSSRCLDLFAGTGALGIEALSRGASHCCFVEQDAKASAQLKANLKLLDVDTQRAQVYHGDAISWLNQDISVQKNTYDLVFIDPPFAKKLWQTSLDALIHSATLTPDALVYLEEPNESAPNFVVPGERIKHKTSGQVSYSLYQIRSAG